MLKWLLNFYVLLLVLTRRVSIISGSNPIDVTDPDWHLYLLIQKKEHKEDPLYQIVGFTAVYKFYRYPDRLRMRLSQVQYNIPQFLNSFRLDSFFILISDLGLAFLPRKRFWKLSRGGCKQSGHSRKRLRSNSRRAIREVPTHSHLHRHKPLARIRPYQTSH